MKEILIAIATLPIFTAVMSLWEQYYPIIVLVGVLALFPLSQILVDRAFVYFSKKLWYRTVKKKLGIDELKKRLIKKLVTENDSSFV